MRRPLALLAEKYTALVQETTEDSGMESLQQKILNFFNVKSKGTDTINSPVGPYTREEVEGTLETLANDNALEAFAKWLGVTSVGALNAVTPEMEPEPALAEMASKYEDDLPLPSIQVVPGERGKDPKIVRGTHGDSDNSGPASTVCNAIAKGLRVRGLITEPAKPGQVIGMVYDNNGKFLGWTTVEDTDKFFYQRGLHFHGARAYRMKVFKGYTFSNDYKVDQVHVVTERATNNIAMFITWRNLKPVETVDSSDKEGIAKATAKDIAAIPAASFDQWFVPPDPYGLLKSMTPKEKRKYEQTLNAAQRQLAAAQSAAQTAYKTALVDFLQSLARGHATIKKSSDDLGIDLDV
jgi:hypothetical protein